MFTTPSGTPLRDGNFRRRVWAPALIAAGVPSTHFHDLRHTGTAGASLRELMDRMGHSSTRVAFIYLNGSDARQRAIADGPASWYSARSGARTRSAGSALGDRIGHAGGTVAKTESVVRLNERSHMRADLGYWPVGVPGLEPGTSSLSGCRRSGSNSGFAIVSWAYARSARFSYPAMPCAYTRAPWRSRATVGPTLGPGTFRSVDSRTGIRARSDRFVTSALFRIGCPSKSEHPRSCSSAWLPAGCSFRRRTRARSRWFLCSRAFAYWRPCPIWGLEAGAFGGSAGRRQ